MSKEKIINDLNDLFKARSKFYEFFDEKIPKLKNSDLFDFEKLDDKNLEQNYKLFYHYDYAIRKLLPAIYEAYEIDTQKDLSKDF